MDPTGHWSWAAAWNTAKSVPRAIAEPALEVYDVALVGGAKVMGIPSDHVELQSALGRRQQGRIEEGQSVAKTATKGVAEVGAAVVTRGLSVIGQAYGETAIDYSQGKLSVDELDERLTSIATGTAITAAVGSGLEKVGGRGWTGRGGNTATRIGEGNKGSASDLPATNETPPPAAAPGGGRGAVGGRGDKSAFAREAEDIVSNETGVPRNPQGPGQQTIPGSGPGGERVPDLKVRGPEGSVRQRGTVIEVKASEAGETFGDLSGRSRQQLADSVDFARRLRAKATLAKDPAVVEKLENARVEVFSDLPAPTRGKFAELINQGLIEWKPIPRRQ